MMIRPVVGLVLIFLLPFSALTQQWARQESGTTATLRGVWFVDSLNGWVCGDSGIVLHTTNAGIDWSRQNSTVSVTLRGIFFLDSLNGWICGDSGTIVNTSDAGTSWDRRTTPVHSLLHHIQFPTPRYGVASGERGTLVESNDSGRTWTASPGSDSGTASAIFFWMDNRRGTILLNETHMQFFTQDAGMTWQPFAMIPRYVNDISGFRAMHDPNFFRVFYFDVGERGFALWWYYCEDSLGGPICPAVGQIGFTGDTLTLNKVTLERRSSQPLRLWAVGETGWIISSTDTGKTWQTIAGGASMNLYGVSFPKDGQGWAVGDLGTILHYGGTVGVGGSTALIPSSFVISNPFPNPFNSSATLQYSLPHRDRVVIDVFDILGRKVVRLSDEILEPGSYSIRFDGTHFTSGLYMCRVQTNKIGKVVKLLLLR